MTATPTRLPGLKTALSLASPGGARGKLSILIYHRVLSAPDPLRTGDPDADTFRWQMALLARHFVVLPLGEAARRLREGSLPPRAACVTFDDGYADNFTTALPILRELGLPATFFIATAYLDGGRMFNDTLIEFAKAVPAGPCELTAVGLGLQSVDTAQDRRALMASLIGHFKYQRPEQRLPAAEKLAADFGIRLPDDLMMSSAQLRALHAAGMEIGGHTDTHPILARQTPDDARHEIRRGREKLEALLGEPIRVFAYPNGRPGKDYDDTHVGIVADCGFEAAVSTRPAAADRRCGIHELPRFTPWDRTPARFGLRLLRSLMLPRSVGG
ncbi:polysaccharide deacetylase family protein [Thauera phenolivorans]|uniref:polysaccharide deacetylase family protein n=1 Tax=Thauera phenolivorans TaxID=1792543 RepID=UPI00083B0730|nr:polysaccharide deacetylase family protein [Thauera phenolivorans]